MLYGAVGATLVIARGGHKDLLSVGPVLMFGATPGVPFRAGTRPQTWLRNVSNFWGAPWDTLSGGHSARPYVGCSTLWVDIA